MKLTNKILTGLSILAICITSAQAAYITGAAPQVIIPTEPVVETALNNDLILKMQEALLDANLELNKFNDQKDLVKGFGNANAYASRAATQQGYQDYDVFAVTTGFMAAVQLPSWDPDYYDNIDEKVKEEGDIYAGLGIGVALINAGVHGGIIHPDLWGWYFNFKFGHLSLDGGDFSDSLDDLSVNTTLIGIGANYTFIKTTSFLGGLFKWRGISFGSGIYYNSTKIQRFFLVKQS